MTIARPSPAGHSISAVSPVVNRASVWHAEPPMRAALRNVTSPRLAGFAANAWNTGCRPSAGASARAVAGLPPSAAAIRSVDPAPSTSPTTSPSTSGPAAMKMPPPCCA